MLDNNSYLNQSQSKEFYWRKCLKKVLWSSFISMKVTRTLIFSSFGYRGVGNIRTKLRYDHGPWFMIHDSWTNFALIETDWETKTNWFLIRNNWWKKFPNSLVHAREPESVSWFFETISESLIFGLFSEIEHWNLFRTNWNEISLPISGSVFFQPFYSAI